MQPCLALLPQCNKPRNNSDLSGVQKKILHPLQQVPSLAAHFYTSNIKTNQAFAHLWQVTSQWLAMCSADYNRCPYFWKITQALESGLQYKPVLPLPQQEHITCTSCAFASPSGDTASIKVTVAYYADLYKMNFGHRSWAQTALQRRPQTCILVSSYQGMWWSQQLH